ncbi:MAG: serine/threonine-protein kinase [Planctomycetales bacterium]
MMTNPVTPPEDAELDRLIAECMRRVDRGETIDAERLIAEHPRQAAGLRDYFASLAEFEQLAATVHGDFGGSGGAAPVAAEADTLPWSSSDSAKSGSTVPDPPLSRVQSGPVEFGRYRLLELLGQGAMGAVYLAHDMRLDRRVALKFPKLEGSDPAEALARFQREARAAAQVQHPHICPIFDVGEIDGVSYISMAFVEGRTLAAWIRSPGPPSQRDAARLARKLALALAEAHERGVVHRDLKPSNVLIDPRGEPVVTDFGLARTLHGESGAQLTQAGAMLGTPSYMAPEQVDPAWGEVGPATDVYALGAVLYEMLAGRPPFQGSAASVIGQIVSRDPARPSTVAARVDPRLEAYCLAMMAKRPMSRPASMREAAAALDAIAARLDDGSAGSAATSGADADGRGEAMSSGSRRASRVLLLAGVLVFVAAVAVAVPLLLPSGETPRSASPNEPGTPGGVAPVGDANGDRGAVPDENPHAARRGRLPEGTLLREPFEDDSLEQRFDLSFDVNFHRWAVEGGALRGETLLPDGPRSFAVRSKQSFELDEQGLKYSARMGRPEGAVPGGSSIGLLFGNYCLDFHPGHPAPGGSGDFGAVTLRKEVDGKQQPLFQGVGMPFIPALEAEHTVTVRVTPVEKKLLVRIRIEGPDRDGNPGVFERRYLDDEPDLGDGKIGVIIQGRNPPGTNAAFFDDLEVARPAN